MSHVAEGDLHAFLDGALTEYPEAEATRIRHHLDVCPACKQSLEEAADARATASSVLELTDPGEILLLPFEDLRRRAEREVQTSKSVESTVPRHVRFAWAATVVLALGVGWGVGSMGPEGRVARVQSARDATTFEDTRPPTASEPTAAERGSAGGPMDGLSSASPSPATSSAASELPRPARGEELRTEAAESARAGDEHLRSSLADASEAPSVGEMVVAGRLDEPAAPGAAPEEPPGAAAEQQRVVAAPVELRPGADPEAPLPALDLRRESGALGQFRQGTDSSSSAELERPAGADAFSAELEQDRVGRVVGAAVPEELVQPASLAVPGLAVEGVEWVQIPTGLSGIRVAQRLPDGARIELIFVGFGSLALQSAAGGRVALDLAEAREVSHEAAEAQVLAALPLPEGWTQVSRPFRGGSLVVRAALPETRLRELADVVR